MHARDRGRQRSLRDGGQPVDMRDRSVQRRRGFGLVQAFDEQEREHEARLPFESREGDRDGVVAVHEATPFSAARTLLRSCSMRKGLGKQAWMPASSRSRIVFCVP